MIEDEKYLPYYLLSQHSAFYKMFDIQNVEIEEGTHLQDINIKPSYRPRPLSYLTDDYDVQFIGWSTRHGHPHLLSASYYLFWTFDCLLLWIFFRHYLGLDSYVSGLLLLLLSTDVVLFYCGNYFRSSKPGGTFFMIAALLPFAESIRSHFRSLTSVRTFTFAALGSVLLFCACLYDEIPAAFAVAGVIVLGLEYLFRQESSTSKACRATLIALVAVIVVFAWWDVVGFPDVVAAVTGEKVWMSFQTGTAHALFKQPAIVLTGAVSMFADAFGCLLGGVSSVLALVALLIVGAIWDCRLDTGPRQWNFTSRWSLLKSQPAISRLLLSALLMIVVLYGMISRHPPIMGSDARRTPYALAFTAAFLCFVAASLARALQTDVLSRGMAQLILLILVASNIAFLPAQRRILISHSRDSLQFTRVLLVMLHKPWLSLPDFPGPPDFERLKKEVAKTNMYQALRQELPEAVNPPPHARIRN